MAEYGLEAWDASGKKTLSINDRLGRFLGSFRVPEQLSNGSRRTIFNIPVEHQNKGRIFVWYDPQWVVWHEFAPGVTNVVTITSNQIIVDISVYDRSTDGVGQLAFDIFYGVF